MNVKVGDLVLFDHFGAKDRRGHVVKITATKLHVEWTAPSSGITRVVPIGLRPFTYDHGHGDVQTYPAQYLPHDKNVRVYVGAYSGYVPLEVVMAMPTPCECYGSTLYELPDPRALHYCPTHAHAPAMLALLRERPIVRTAGAEYDALIAWQARVESVLTQIGG